LSPEIMNPSAFGASLAVNHVGPPPWLTAPGRHAPLLKPDPQEGPQNAAGRNPSISAESEKET